MKSTVTLGVALAAVAFAGPAMAGTAKTASQEPAAEAKADTAAGAGATASATYTDEELGRYAKAAVAVHKINSDATLDATAKQAGMAKAVEAEGLSNIRFNEISVASQKDAKLLEKIQQSAAQAQTANAAPATGNAAADATAATPGAAAADTAATAN
jgi:hypothetical protein